MSTFATVRELWAAVSTADRLERLRARLLAVVFGDRYGLTLFLGTLVVLTGVTRVGFFITDTYTVANAFAALTDGHLAVTDPLYGDNLNTPGMFQVDGQWYGRNYGQIVAAIPAYLLIQAVSLVADLRIALVGGWSVLVVALALQIGRLTDRYEQFAVGGGAVALVAFLSNVAVATPLDPMLAHILALQLTSMVAAALLAVVVYRLVTLLRSSRLGLVTAVVVLIGTPVAFWAPIPKRHVLTTLLATTAVYALARSRSDVVPSVARRTHALAYACVGFTAWVHAPEAVLVGLALLLADLPALPEFSRRRLATVGAIAAVSMVPFLITNLLISGDPFLAPRLVTRVGVSVVSTRNIPVATAGIGSLALQSAGTSVVDDLVTGVRLYIDQLRQGVTVALSEPDRLYHTFVRSGFVAENAPGGTQAINLALLESAPVVVSVVVAPFVTVTSLWRERTDALSTRLTGPDGAAGIGLAVFGLLTTFLYIPRLPLFAQVTVRYLLPLFVVGVVAVVLATPIGRALTDHVGTFAWTTTGGVLVGSQLLVVAVVQIDPAVGEAFQFHALLGLATAAPVLLWTVVGVFTDRLDRVGAALIGTATATASVFTLFVVTGYTSAIGVYPFDGDQALPVVRVLADLLSLV